MRLLRHARPLMVALAPALLGASEHAASADFFENRIRPVLVERCHECHSAAVEKPKGGLRVDTREGLRKGGASGPAIVPGKPDESLLVQVLRGPVHDVERMPSKGEPLPPAVIAAFADWIRAGAADPRADAAAPRPSAAGHWAFRAPRMPATPAVKRRAWIRTGVDAFVLAALEARGLRPSPEADPRTMLRRAALDLTGLPPDPAEMRAFLADGSPDAYVRAVDRLLASPAYGERSARHWLDVARYADSKGYVFEEERRYPYSYTYRDWVVRAFNRDMPYDRFIVEQIAGDQLADASDPSPLAAMGFLTLGRRFLNNPPDIIDDRIDVVTRGLMGLTVQCARCHDHKYDPIPTADYYSLYGVFSNSREPDEKPLLGLNPDPVQAALFEAERAKRRKELADYRAERTAEVMRKLRERVGDYLAAARDSASLDWTNLEGLARERSLDPGLVAAWKQRLEQWQTASHPVFAPWFAFSALPKDAFRERSDAIVREVAGGKLGMVALNPRLVAELKGAAPTNFAEIARHYGALLTTVESEWRDALEAAKKAGLAEPAALADPATEQLRLVLHGPDSPLQELRNGIDRFFDTPVAQRNRALQRKIDELDATHPGAPLRAMAMVDNASFADPVIFKRGNPGNHGPVVPRRQLALVAGEDRKPFGKGSGRLEMAQSIASGENPFTARVFVNRVWMRHFGTPLVRTPSDFGVRSEPPTHPALLDYLAVRFIQSGWSVKALHREMILSAAYRQSSDPRAGGSRGDVVARAESVDPGNTLYWRMNRKRLDFESMRDGLLAVSGRLDRSLGGQPVEVYETEKPSDRRTLYGFIDRQNLPGILRTFDFASPDSTSPGRYQTSVPQQALFWLNSRFVADQSSALLSRPELAAADAPARIRRLYDLLYQRAPDAREIAAGTEFVAAAGPAMPEPAPGAAWKYGLGHFDHAAGRVPDFRQMTVYKHDRWQGGDQFPVDGPRGYLSLTPSGGHPGNDTNRSAIRRWVAPAKMRVAIRGQVRHPSASGDGIEAIVVSDRAGRLGSWIVHHGMDKAEVASVDVAAGEAIDFVADVRGGPDSDSFEWAPEIAEIGGRGRIWSAKADFSGPRQWPRGLDAWQQYAQVLLASNEFSFAD